MVDKRRADRAFPDREEIMRAVAKIADGEARACTHMEASTVAIVERRRSMTLQFNRKLQLGNAAQRFFQNLRFEMKLVFIADVLIVATATLREIWTWRRVAQL